MITASGVVRYCNSVYKSSAIYLWGADLQVLTEELFKKLKKTYGETHYSKISIDKDSGKLGADCSGLLTPISGKNQTAQAYYNQCIVKGKSKDIPKDKVCLVFRGKENGIYHVGIYTGDGKTTEMVNSGCEQKTFKSSQWEFYGIPDWINQGIADVASNDNIKECQFTIKPIVPDLSYREGPSTNYNVVGQLKEGTKYTIIEVRGNWGKLKSGVGWCNISTKYVEYVD